MKENNPRAPSSSRGASLRACRETAFRVGLWNWGEAGVISGQSSCHGSHWVGEFELWCAASPEKREEKRRSRPPIGNRCPSRGSVREWCVRLIEGLGIVSWGPQSLVIVSVHHLLVVALMLASGVEWIMGNESTLLYLRVLYSTLLYFDNRIIGNT